MSTAVLLLLAAAAGLVLCALGCLLMKRRAERRNPPLGAFLDVDGVRLHYILRGDENSPPVLLLHGNGAMVQEQLISGMIDALAPRYRVLCFDRPGFGYSARPRFRQWTPEAEARLFATAMERLGFARAVVLGHSWGTLVAIALALQTPAAVRGLVLVAGYYFPTRRADVAVMRVAAAPVFADLFHATLAPLIGRLTAWSVVRKMFSPQPVSERFAREFPMDLSLRPLATRTSAEESALMMPACARLAPHYPSLDLPIAVLAGDSDWLIYEDQSAQLAAVLPNATLQILPGHGHMVTHTATAAVVAAVDGIAQRADAPALASA